MKKTYKSIAQQVRLLQGRRAAIDDDTPKILLREGYYAVVNGYGKAFLDREATERAHDDRYRIGTRFNDIYQLFLFDRELRALTFKAIMCIECTLRSVLSHTFCEYHRAADAYLQRNCYTSARGYLRGERAHDGDLTWMINTLEHHARGHVGDERDDDPGNSERVAWYREHYESVPLWVLFSDLTFGNLRYFFALMRRKEQQAVCSRMLEACGTTRDGDALSPAEMLSDLEVLSSLRNDCAHEERIYDAVYGPAEWGYQQVLDVLVAYLGDRDEAQLLEGVQRLVTQYSERYPAVAEALAAAGFNA